MSYSESEVVDRSAPRSRTRADWQAVLRDQGIRPSRSMGQNFLVDPSVVQRIADVAGVGDGDLVVEIGSGMGILTSELLARGAAIVAVELDSELTRFLEQDLGSHERLTIVERDARYVEIEQHVGSRPYTVVANLPYSVATVIIRHFLESTSPPRALHVMVQREVAVRMTATPPHMSLLALACQLSTESEVAFVVPPEMFLPPPKVESAVVSMHIRPVMPIGHTDRDRLFQLATMAFQRKRKTIANGLSQGLDKPKRDLEPALRESRIDPMRRPETLSVEEWIALAENLPE